jgi:GT2 family glycosyltransferase
MKSAISLIVKNECQDLAEWIAHYTELGADQLVIYNDGSDDGTTELLDRLSQTFPVRHIRWNTSESSSQTAAYADCLKQFGSEFDWIGFLDGDEFLIPPSGQLLADLLNRHQNHDAIAINWLVFGTSGVADTNGALITETLTHRAEDDFAANAHVKIFVRPPKFKKVSNPHYFQGFTDWADVTGRPIVWSDIPGITKEVVVGDWRLHHYVLRSDAHWARRLKRGRPNSNAARDQIFFDEHNRNDIVDTTALPFAQRTKERLHQAGLFDLKKPPKPVFRQPRIGLHGSHAQHKDLGRPRIFGCVDGFHKNNLRGWVLLRNDDERVGGLTVEITCNGVVIGHTVANVARHDVARVHNADTMCGFVFEVPIAFRRTSVQDFGVHVTNYDVELLPRVNHAFISHGSSLEISNSTVRDYPIWAAIRQQSLRADYGRSVVPDAPLASIICSVQNPDTGNFVETIESVLKQTHPNWELILVHNDSGQNDLLLQLEAYRTRDPRIALIQSERACDITAECLRRVLETQYGNFAVILVDNNSEEEATQRFCDDAVKDSRIRVMRITEPFNYSRLNNLAAREAKAAYLVLMNNDLHVCDPLWLRTMVNEATADNRVGIVGGKFFYPGDAGIQHAGVVTGVGGVACHIHGELQPNDPGFCARAVLAQELTVVTAACLLVNRQLFGEIGGLDEKNLTVAFNDVDLCLEARQKGAKVIWTPSFVAIHHESLSRGTDNDQAKAARFNREVAHMQKKWGVTLARDPHYHPAFALDVDDAFHHLRDPRRRDKATLPGPFPAGKWVHG